ncbi:hypothetical protein HYE68_011165 [Fusarium pseudograminearum]|nr:hypothetical protein HYE68_011165 [Fusarium pseudograminearum]
MKTSQRTVIIAGGGISGLTLANMLERAGIHYILLESYEKIAPQVGASIGLSPNGLRILDQLGCAEELMSLVDIPLDDSYTRNSDGSVIKHHRYMQSRSIERHGYPTIFIDRQMLMQALYDNLNSTDSVYPGQGVVSVTELDDGIQVTTDKGKVFKGQILIGADGIYSTVRKEMWRIANEASPGYFPADEWSSVPCYYKCIFGISHPIKALAKGGHFVYNDSFSYLVLVGPGGRLYWFLFVKLPVPLYGHDIPRYTKHEEETLALQHACDNITPEVTFGQLYEARNSSTLTPLHEYVFAKWHYNRIITIGDSAHKFEPLTGQGGNSAIETAASLVNHLISDTCSSWSTPEIEEAFSSVRKERFERVQWLVNDAHQTQQTHAKTTPYLAAVGPLIARLMDTETYVRLGGLKYQGATRISNIPMPQREHKAPFDDELPAKPRPWNWFPTVLGVLSQGALYRLGKQILLPSLQVPTTFGGDPLVQHYTGVGTLDELLRILVAVFGVPLASNNTAANLQWISFTPLLLSTILDWNLESYRVGSKGLLTSFPSVFGVLFQLKGIGRIAPLYHLISVCEHTIRGSMDTIACPSIDIGTVKSVVLGGTLGYIFPSALMLWPFKNKATWQKVTALWQPFPLYVGLITAGLSSILCKQRASTTDIQVQSKTPEEKTMLRNPKRATHSNLKIVYVVGIATAAAFHLWSLYRISSSSDLSLTGVFGEIGYMVSGAQSSDPTYSVLGFFQRDMFLTAASVLAYNIYRILDLRCLGYITNKETLTATLAVLFTQPVFGPAAAHVGFLGWREEIFARIHRHSSTCK